MNQKLNQPAANIFLIYIYKNLKIIMNFFARKKMKIQQSIMSSKLSHKIITKANDTVDTIRGIINGKKPGILILESGKSCGLCSQLNMNQKTYWIAQNLASDGWKIDKLTHYKGKLFKVILSLK